MVARMHNVAKRQSTGTAVQSLVRIRSVLPSILPAQALPASNRPTRNSDAHRTLCYLPAPSWVSPSAETQLLFPLRLVPVVEFPEVIHTMRPIQDFETPRVLELDLRGDEIVAQEQGEAAARF